MYPGSTLLVDVATQRDLWPGGAWPLLDARKAQRTRRLLALAPALGLRQGGILCIHDAPPLGAPEHCRQGTDGCARATGCALVPPARVWPVTASAPAPLDRRAPPYLATGCALPVDTNAVMTRLFDHLTAGIRDAVVLGAGLELGVRHVVQALLGRRIRVHVALDAVGAVSEEGAQAIVAEWKRLTVDVTTAAMVERLLTR